jgi:hypothetical protein
MLQAVGLLCVGALFAVGIGKLAVASIRLVGWLVVGALLARLLSSGASMPQEMQSIIIHLIPGAMLLMCLAVLLSNAGGRQGE